MSLWGHEGYYVMSPAMSAIISFGHGTRVVAVLRGFSEVTVWFIAAEADADTTPIDSASTRLTVHTPTLSIPQPPLTRCSAAERARSAIVPVRRLEDHLISNPRQGWRTERQT